MNFYTQETDPYHFGVRASYDWQLSVLVVRAIQPTLDLLSSSSIPEKNLRILTGLLEQADAALVQGEMAEGVKLLHKFQTRVRPLVHDKHLAKALIESVREIRYYAEMENGN